MGESLFHHFVEVDVIFQSILYYGKGARLVTVETCQIDSRRVFHQTVS